MLTGELTPQANWQRIAALTVALIAAIPAVLGAAVMFFIDFRMGTLGSGQVPICSLTGIVVLVVVAYGLWHFLLHVPAYSIRSFTLASDELTVVTLRGETRHCLLDGLKSVQLKRSGKGHTIYGYWLQFDSGSLWLNNQTTNARPLIDDLERMLNQATGARTS